MNCEKLRIAPCKLSRSAHKIADKSLWLAVKTTKISLCFHLPPFSLSPLLLHSLTHTHAHMQVFKKYMTGW